MPIKTRNTSYGPPVGRRVCVIRPKLRPFGPPLQRILPRRYFFPNSRARVTGEHRARHTLTYLIAMKLAGSSHLDSLNSLVASTMTCPLASVLIA